MTSLTEIRTALTASDGIAVDPESSDDLLLLAVDAPFLGQVRVFVHQRDPDTRVVIAPCFKWGELDPGTVAVFLANEVGPLGLMIDGDQLCLGSVLAGQADRATVEWLVRFVARGTDALFEEFSPKADVCANCGTERVGEARFCGNCGAPIEAPSAAAEPTNPNVITAGTYIVGSDIQPGLYRVSGYFARLDAHHGIIDNDSARSGLVLVRIYPSDSYVEISGEAMSVEFMPSVDPIASQYRDGTYMVGVDIPPGRYRISDPGGTAFAFVKDRDLSTTRSESNRGSVIVTLSTADFALSFSGLLESV